ncbi:hypothetical protein GCM10028818_57300 [Spirosoma horti]
MKAETIKLPIDLYRQYLTLTDEQLNQAVLVIETCRQRGIFSSLTRPVDSFKPGLFDSAYSRSWHDQFSEHSARHTYFVESNIRYFTALLLTNLMDNWGLHPDEINEEFYHLLLETKPVFDAQYKKQINGLRAPIFEAEMDLALLRFVDSTICCQLIPRKKMSADEEVECFNEGNAELEPTLSISDYIAEETLESLLVSSSQVTANKFLKKISPNLLGSYDPLDFSAPLSPPEEDTAIKQGSLANLNRLNTEELINRLAESDIDLLSSIPWHSIQACPNCFSRALAERKKETDEGTHYCSACRKRVRPAYVPFYTENYTADPHIAVTKHRRHLTKLITDKIAGLKRLESLKVSGWKRRCYFISLDHIDEKAYKDLALLYEAFYDDYTADTPDAKLQIQLCSNGGNVFQAKRISALINANQHITHVQGNVLNSAAFDIFFTVTCSRELTPYAQGMYHLARSAHFVLENGLVPSWQQTINGEESLALCEQVGMTEGEVGRIKSGEDVYFTYARLNDFLEQSTAHKPISRDISNAHSYAADITAIAKRFTDSN